MFTEQLKETKKLLQKDKRLDENPLLKRLYEVDLTDEEIDFGNVDTKTCYHFWSYNQSINIENFQIAYQQQNALEPNFTESFLSQFLLKVIK